MSGGATAHRYPGAPNVPHPWAPGKRGGLRVLRALRVSRTHRSRALGDPRFALEEHLGRPVDLVNARQASIVLQKEIISTGACVFTAEQSLVDEYEMIVLSLYGKLNDERREILAEFRRTWRAYRV